MAITLRGNTAGVNTFKTALRGLTVLQAQICNMVIATGAVLKEKQEINTCGRQNDAAAFYTGYFIYKPGLYKRGMQ